MHRLYYILTLVLFLVVFFVGAVKEFMLFCYSLAPEITLAIVVNTCISPMYFWYLNLTKRNTLRHKNMFSFVSVSCASVSVSLGLIGTFLGLTTMIQSISSSMGTEGTSIDTMINSMSHSLDAMAYAFVTSILGVGSSIYLTAALPFARIYFEKGERESESEKLKKDLELLNKDNEYLTQSVSELVNKQVTTTNIVTQLCHHVKLASEQHELTVQSHKEVTTLLSGMSDGLARIAEGNESKCNSMIDILMSINDKHKESEGKILSVLNNTLEVSNLYFEHDINQQREILESLKGNLEANNKNNALLEFIRMKSSFLPDAVDGIEYMIKDNKKNYDTLISIGENNHECLVSIQSGIGNLEELTESSEKSRENEFTVYRNLVESLEEKNRNFIEKVKSVLKLLIEK
ncbi:MotA/TolQ/ExbB proton channel family protein [Vibrio barjaei]|uniref:MotA/TolQ/ExbB proton channel family protein n=1 Tax=Vibrio barjaei TaxID=1676683 RepID=UPI0022850422|nr:MotA/TolQ/ExbB proton channel family protein [Vibrio barjaei]MCY9874828.1 MotA/TolQ/ExbB proton channel family protein [Vibrio barjaei]